MKTIEIDHKITLISGRPGSGKTRAAIEICRTLLTKNWIIIYWHAEGSERARPTEYGVETVEQLLQMQLITDPFFSPADLRARIQRPTEFVNPVGTLVVIDELDLFDCIPDDFFPFVETFSGETTLHFLVLTQLPKYLEGRTMDHAEEFIRMAYPTEIDHEIIILGNFLAEY